MSLYITTGDKNILNLGKQSTAYDVSTRNPFFATIVGYEAALLNIGLYNCIFGYRAGYNIKKAQRNIFFGANAGFNTNSDDNILIGYDSGRDLVNGIQNVCIGNFSMNKINGNNNIYIGFQNTTNALTLLDSSNNTAVGYNSLVLGYYNLACGNNNDIMSKDLIAYGNGIYDRSSNSMIIGHNINNLGSNVLIINNRYTSCNVLLENLEDNYINIQDTFICQQSNNEEYLILNRDFIDIKGKDSSIMVGDRVLVLTPGINLRGSQSWLELGSNIFLGRAPSAGSIDTSSNVGIHVNNERVWIHGGYGDQYIDQYNTRLSYSNGFILSEITLNNIITLSNNDAVLSLGSNINILNSQNSFLMNDIITLSNAQSKLILGSNYSQINFSNNSVYISSNIISLCNVENTLMLDKSILLSNIDNTLALSSNYSIITQSSNSSIFMDQSIKLNGYDSSIIISSNAVTINNSNNSTLTIDKSFTFHGDNINIVFNSNESSINQSNYSLTLTSNLVSTFNTHGNINIGSNLLSIEYSNLANIKLSNNININASNDIINNSTTKFNSNINTLGRIKFNYSNHYDTHWQIYLHTINSNASDLVFKSKNNTQITWTDDFVPGVLNFTGKHRCSWAGEEDISTLEPGLIVISNGTYNNLLGKCDINIDEAIPEVVMSDIENDTRIFGVISGIESCENSSIYQVGNMIFTKEKEYKKRKIIVNSVGEGAVWVCNIGGVFKNGDLITTSMIKGMGMKQKGKELKTYTVGKITCDCTFDIDSQIYKCEEFVAYGRIYRKAFVGCTYKF